jgi:hypothetical protein
MGQCGVKGTAVGSMPRSGHRHRVMASAQAGPGLGQPETWSGSSPRGDDSGLV